LVSRIMNVTGKSQSLTKLSSRGSSEILFRDSCVFLTHRGHILVGI